MRRHLIARSVKAARKIDETYSVANRVSRIFIWILLAVVLEKVAGWLLPKIDWFWKEFGVVGGIGAGILLCVLVVAVQIINDIRLFRNQQNNPLQIEAGFLKPLQDPYVSDPNASKKALGPADTVAFAFSGGGFRIETPFRCISRLRDGDEKPIFVEELWLRLTASTNLRDVRVSVSVDRHDGTAPLTWEPGEPFHGDVTAGAFTELHLTSRPLAGWPEFWLFPQGANQPCNGQLASFKVQVLQYAGAPVTRTFDVSFSPGHVPLSDVTSADDIVLCFGDNRGAGRRKFRNY